MKNQELLKAYHIGFQDGVINSLQQALTVGLIRNNRNHVRNSINLGNFLNRNIKIFLQNENNQKITLKKIKLTKEEKMKIKVEDKSNEKQEIKVKKLK